MIRLKYLGFSLLLSVSVAEAESFFAPLPVADWTMAQGDGFCRLEQSIPDYGKADFLHRSGQLLRFSVKESRFKPDITRASLTIGTPSWVHHSPPPDDYLVYLDKNIDIQNYPRLSVYGASAEAMLDILLKGWAPTFIYTRTELSGEQVKTKIAVMPVNFLKNYLLFDRCRKSFLPAGLKQALDGRLFFTAASKQLTAEIQHRLTGIAKYLKAIKGAKVIIASETAKIGNRDKKWFSARTKQVVKKLIALGVAKSSIVVSNAYPETDNLKNIRLGIFGPDGLKLFHYRKGSTQLSAAKKQRLSLLARYANEFLPTRQIVIKSHTDGKGKRAKNLMVSQQRGEVVKRYLISQGVDKNRIKVKAYGESRPIKSNRFPPGRAQNRRLTIGFIQ